MTDKRTGKPWALYLELRQLFLQAFVFLGAGAGKGVLLEGIVGKSQPADGSSSSNLSPPLMAVGEVPSPDATTSMSSSPQHQRR